MSEPNPSTDSPLSAAGVSLHNGIREAAVLGLSDVTITVEAAIVIRDALLAHPESRPDPGEGRPCRYACPAGVHWHGASSVPTDRPEPIDEERLARAAYEVWPSHTEGSMSQPPSEHDATWRVLDPAAFSDRLIRAIAAAYRTEPGETTDE